MGKLTMLNRRAVQLALALLPLLGVAGACSSLAPTDVPAEGERLPFGAFAVTPAFDPFFLRLDLVRQVQVYTITRVTPEGFVVPETRTEATPYHYIGVDLGGGLFLDARQNLALDLWRVMELNRYARVRIIERSGGWFSSDRIYARNGDEISVNSGGLFGGDRRITLSPGGARIAGGFLTSDQDVRLDADRVAYDPHGLFGAWSVVEIKRTGEFGANLPSGSVSGSADELTISRVGKLQRFADRIELRRDRGLFDEGDVLTLVRSANRLVVTDRDLRGFKIEFQDRRVIVTGAGGIGAASREYEVHFD
jgi:hypothetical protein